MSKKTIVIFAAIAACAVLLFALIPESTGGSLMVLALPFTLLGDGLRAMSLSGAVGNVVAIMLYAAVSLSPMLFAVKRKWQREDWLLVVASAVMFYVVYFMINPGLMPRTMNSNVGKLIYSSAVYSVLVSWGLMKLLRAGDAVRQQNIYKALRIFLMLCAAECVLLGFGVGFGDFRSTTASVRESNTMPGINLTTTYVFAFLSFAAGALEYSLDALVMLWGAKLLQELEADPYSEACCNVADRLETLCKQALKIITMSVLGLNLGQVVFAGELYDIDATLYIPVFSIALVFGTLALTRLLSQGKELKEDNDLFI